MGIITLAKLCDILDISRGYASKLCRDGVFPNAELQANAWLIPKQDVVNYLESQKKETLNKVENIDDLVKQVKNL